MQTVFHLHLISDATGETLSAIARACLAQFDDVSVVEHVWSLVRTDGQVDRVLTTIEANPGVVLCTVVDPHIRERLQHGCEALRAPCISVLDPTLAALSRFLDRPTRGRPGGQHALDSGYFRRIEAMDYTLRHDDGQNLDTLDRADIVLVGVSRTSKTPTCLYLANRGYKTANVPLVDPHNPPHQLLDADEPLIIGLTSDPRRLAEIRRSRLTHVTGGDASTIESYADLEEIKREVKAARRLFSSQGWSVIDVSRRSIEETAAAVLRRWSESGRATPL